MSSATPPHTGFPFLDEPRERGAVIAMAHRGGARHPEVVGLENTSTAFASAVRLGYRYLETDVHATRDGQLLAFHDRLLDRLTDCTGGVCDREYADFVGVLVGGREPIPRLSDLLEEFPQARFNVDLKSPQAVEPMARLVVRTRAQDRVCVGSFSERVLRGFRRVLAALGSPPVATSCGLAASVAGWLGAGRLLQPGLRDAGAVFQVPHRHRGVRVVDRGFVRRAHATGRQVHVWTVDDRAEMEELLDLGVDGLISDRTDVLRGVLEARGQWEGVR